VRLAGKPCGPKRGLWRATVVALDYEQRWVELDAALPAEGWDGAGVYFTNHRYSRTTAYRVYGVEPAGGRTRIRLGPQPMLLGQGRVHQRTAGGVLLSDVPHEYARSVVGGRNTRFFDGKLLRGAGGAATHIQSVEARVPMRIAVDRIDGFKEGEALLYYDVQQGDEALVPTCWQGTLDAPQAMR